MKVYFNSLGVITNVDTTGDSLRQGSVNVKLEAIFDEINNNNYTAKFNFTRSDNSKISNVVMQWDSSNVEKFFYYFDDAWFFAKAGVTTLTIFLYNASGTIIAQGQYQFSIEQTDYDNEPNITVNQYNSLLIALAGKVGMPTTYLMVTELPAAGTTGIFYVIHDIPTDSTRANIYVWNSNTSQYIWVGSNELDLGKYYTKAEGTAFEENIQGQIDSFIEEVNGEIDNFESETNENIASYKATINARVTSIESEVQSASSGSPAGVYESVEALTTAKPTGDNKVYLVTADSKWYYWYSTNNAWTAGGTYLASPADNFVSDSSTNPIQTKKATSMLKTLNTVLEDFDDIYSGKFINKNSGNLETGLSSSQYTDYIECTETDVFLVEGTTLQNTCLIATYNANKTFLRSYYGGSSSTVTETVSFSPQSDEHFVRFSSYTNFTYIKASRKKMLNAFILENVVNFLFNPTKYINDIYFEPETTVGGYINKTNGNIISVSGTGIYTDYVELNTRQKYIITARSQQNTCVIATYDSNKNFIRSYGDSVSWSEHEWIPSKDEVYARFASYPNIHYSFERKIIPFPDNIVDLINGFKTNKHAWNPSKLLVENIEQELNITHGGFINKSNGDVEAVSNQGYYSDFVSLKPTDKFYITGITFGSTCLIAVYNSNKQFLRSYYPAQAAENSSSGCRN